VRECADLHPSLAGWGKGSSHSPRGFRMPEVSAKVCTQCSRALPVESFYLKRDKRRRPDLREAKCTSCYNKAKNAAVGYTPERNRSQWQKRRDDPERYARKLAYQSAWREQNAEKVAAHRKCKTAKRNGTLVSPEQCEWCGAAARLDMHHEDYSKPLDVKWLCRRCHRRA
jgi:hypothetical protein